MLAAPCVGVVVTLRGQIFALQSHKFVYFKYNTSRSRLVSAMQCEYAAVSHRSWARNMDTALESSPSLEVGFPHIFSA